MRPITPMAPTMQDLTISRATTLNPKSQTLNPKPCKTSQSPAQEQHQSANRQRSNGAHCSLAILDSSYPKSDPAPGRAAYAARADAVRQATGMHFQRPCSNKQQQACGSRGCRRTHRPHRRLLHTILSIIYYYHDLLSEPADAAAGVLGMPQSALDRAEDPRPPPTTDVAALSAPPAQAISVAELGFDTGVAAAAPPRFCTGCGKGFPAGMSFCTGCGTPACELPSPPAFPAPSPPPRDSSPAVMAGSWPAGADSSDEGEFEEGSDSEIMMMA